MRVHDHRYSRDLRRHDLALRMIRHEVRTATICAWTGLSENRIRALYRSYIPEGAVAALRHRGPPPTSVLMLFRSRNLDAEAAALAGLCLAMDVLPTKPVTSAEVASMSTGERLCYAFELYQQLVPKPQITLEQLVMLVSALARGDEISLVHCNSCDGAMLVTILRQPIRRCRHCARRRGGHEGLRAGDSPTDGEAGQGATESRDGLQRSLF